MKQKYFKINWFMLSKTLIVALFALLPSFMVMATQVSDAHAQGLISSFVNTCPRETGIRCSEGTLASVFRLVINWALGIAFLAAVVFLIYGGFTYIISAGNKDTADTGKKAVFNALIGLVIISLSFIIVQVVYRFITGSGGGAIGQ